MEQFAACWEGVEDPRSGNAELHDFHELLTIALCATLCGGQSAVAMARFAESKEAFLRDFLTLKHGLPSHDTFSRLFRQLDPVQFGAAFQRFMARFAETAGGVVAIDNLLWYGRVADADDEAAATVAVRQLNAALAADERIDFVLVPVGDGVGLCRKR